MAELSTKQQTEAAAADLNAKIDKILDLPLEEAVAFVPQVAEAARVLNDTARAEIEDLDARHDAWRERALAAEKKLEPQGQPSSPKPTEPAKPQLRPLTDIRVDPNFSPSKIGGDAGRWLQHVQDMIGSERKRGTLAGMVEKARKEEVGRLGAYHHDSLEPLAGLYGAPWHLEEAVRLFDILIENLKPFVYTIGGKKVTVWEFAWDELSKDQWNDKEDDHGIATLGGYVYAMWANLAAHPENKSRVLRGLEILDALELKWLSRKGNNPEWRIPLDRVVHPALRRLLHLVRRLAMEKNPVVRPSRPEMVKEYGRLIDIATPQIAAEFFYYDDGDGECLTWPYNVLAMTIKDGKKDTDAYITDAYQLSVYCLWVCQITFILGLHGIRPFSTERFQKAMMNGIYWSLLADAPYRYSIVEGGTTYKGEGMSSADMGPRNAPWLDNTKPRPKDRPFQNEYQKRILRKNSEFRKGGSFRQKAGNVEGFPIGTGMLFAPPEMIAFSEAKLWGSLESPKMKSSAHLIFTPAGRAFAEGYKALGYEHFQ